MTSTVRYLRPNEFKYPDTLTRLYPSGSELLHLEVGFGDGRFWSEHHKLEPEVNYLGVEVSGVSVQKALSRYRSKAVQNAIVVRTQAEFMVRNVLTENSLSRVYVNFPDPWPKARHEDARFLRPQVFELLSTRLVNNAEVWLTTDHPGYFEFALESASNTGLFEVSKPAPPAAALQTKYAMKWQGMQLEIFHARFQKRIVSQQSFLPLEIGETVPHSQLRGEIPAPPKEKIVFKGSGYTVIVLEGFGRDSKLALLTRIEEIDFTQEILITVAKHDNGRLIAGLESFGSPLITPGVKAAVGVVTDWLESQGLTVVQRSY
jgi:tRNA (guanine-N7-)-methyltransferase